MTTIPGTLNAFLQATIESETVIASKLYGHEASQVLDLVLITKMVALKVSAHEAVLNFQGSQRPQDLEEVLLAIRQDVRELIVSSLLEEGMTSNGNRQRSPEIMDISKLARFSRKFIKDPRKVTVIFDFDGTISTLRGGWRSVMFNYMLETMLQANETLERRKDSMDLGEEIQDYIESSIGVETIFQMEWLQIYLLRNFGSSSTAVEHKHAFLSRLKAHYEHKVQELKEDPSKRDSHLIPGIDLLIKDLRDKFSRNIEIWVASGTDTAGVREELRLLGFIENIHISRAIGATDKLESPKKRAIEEACSKGPCIVIGDGPMEMKYADEYGALPIGIWRSDDGLMMDPEKRKRLIKSGACILTQDHKGTSNVIRNIFSEEFLIFRA